MSDLNTLRTAFQHFATLDGRDDPLYVALADAVARDDALLALLLEAPPTERKPVLLFAALHDLLLAGTPHPLAAYYASCGGTRAPDAELPGCLRDFVQQHAAPLRERLRMRRTQTNEVGRAAVLWLVLQQLAALTQRSDFALLDFGCSAGLNLGVDAVWVDDGQGGYGEPGGLTLCTAWRGERPTGLLGTRRWHLAARAGADLEPIEPRNPEATRWLQACLWPGDAARRGRLAQALHQALVRGDTLLRSPDSLGALLALPLPAGAVPVIFNAWVLAYLDEPAWRAHCQRARAWVAERGGAWISAEALARSPIQLALPEGEAAGSATLWTLCWRDAAGRMQERALAWSHPHGRWVRWHGGGSEPPLHPG